MANWSTIQNLVEAVLQGQGAQTGFNGRSLQALWYFREGVRRSVQDFRETVTPKVYPWTAAGGSVGVILATSAGRFYGVLVDNSHASNNFWVQLFNLDSGSVTLGTTNPTLSITAPAATMSAYIFAAPLATAAANPGYCWQATTTPSGSTTTNNTTVSIAAVYGS